MPRVSHRLRDRARLFSCRILGSMKHAKRIGTDIAGYALVLLGLATGWLPGPGGIPLILAGLGLLSIHNTWAKHIKDFFLQRGSELMGYLFPHDPRAQAAHDFIAALLLGLAVYMWLTSTQAWQFGIAFGLTALAIVDFLYNRDRLRYFRKKR